MPDNSPSTSPEIEEQILEPSGIIRTATEVIDASDLGGGILLPLGAAPLPDSFTEVELLSAGDATSYAPLASLTADGFWTFQIWKHLHLQVPPCILTLHGVATPRQKKSGKTSSLHLSTSNPRHFRC